MSGGVDSSVSAALLKEQGYDVVGVFIKVWSPPWLPCHWPEERRDAIRVAAHLNIPFVTMDLEAEYKKEVVDYMVREYKAGRTPNPDVMCNKHVKFGAFLKNALLAGADFVATGHYAEKRGTETVPELHAGKDTSKDQSYFLWTLERKQLQHSLFPVGGLPKSEVRKLAKKFGLPVAEKKDSQGLCFVGHVDMKDFLREFFTPRPGVVLDESGNEIGTHEGVELYTIGERHGFLVNKKGANDEPSYVVGKNLENNTITVSANKPVQKSVERGIQIVSTNWISGIPESGKKFKARIRYREALKACTVLITSAETAVVAFDEPEVAVTPGQSLVVYDSTRCLGGGVIA